jgi:hypothetical protein
VTSRGNHEPFAIFVPDAIDRQIFEIVRLCQQVTGNFSEAFAKR